MTHLDKFKQQTSSIVFLGILLPGLVGLGSFIVLREWLALPLWLAILMSSTIFVVAAAGMYAYLIRLLREPVESIWQAVLHVSPGNHAVTPPKLDSLHMGRELISSLVLQIYDFASHTANQPTAQTDTQSPETGGLIESLPFALFILDKDRRITIANQPACQTLGLTKDKVLGKNIYDVLHLSFVSNDTLDSWLKHVNENRATDSKSWEHVRATLGDGKTQRQFDVSASFSRDNPEGHEIILALFDKSTVYNQADVSTSYVALAVHELRTPLTVLRGYIEVFEDELSGRLTPELQEFMRKMNASAQALSAFVSNILNVARIDESQLNMSLHEARWDKVLQEIVSDLELRASVRHKTIALEIEPDLPTVAIDKISMYEVVSNLVDNAIKYSGQADKIIVRVSKGKEGNVDTVVQDFGVGIPESAMANLFTKYYRSHRSKNSVSGSGLGLYLVKAIIEAHGGHVWVNSKEGEGSSFGFSLQTFTSANQAATTNTDGIERHASGWIKNHSLYRR